MNKKTNQRSKTKVIDVQNVDEQDNLVMKVNKKQTINSNGSTQQSSNRPPYAKSRAARSVTSRTTKLSIAEQQQMFQSIYKALQVKSIDQLRFSKGQLNEIKRKFNKLSRMGIDQQYFRDQKRQKNVLNPNKTIYKMEYGSEDSDEEEVKAEPQFGASRGDHNEDGKSSLSLFSTRINQSQLQQEVIISDKHMKLMQNKRLMPLEQFRSFFGLLGQGNNPYLSDRIFRIADQDRDQHITFEEFATVLDIYQNGTNQEKNELSFALFDENLDGLMKFEDLYSVMKKFMSHWSTLQGSNATVDKNSLRRIFQTIDKDGDGHVTLQEYKLTLQKKPGLFNWFDILNNNTSRTDNKTIEQETKVDKQKQNQDKDTVQDLMKFYVDLQTQLSTLEQQVKLADVKNRERSLGRQFTYGSYEDTGSLQYMSNMEFRSDLKTNRSPQTDPNAYHRAAKTNLYIKNRQNSCDSVDRYKGINKSLVFMPNATMPINDLKVNLKAMQHQQQMDIYEQERQKRKKQTGVSKKTPFAQVKKQETSDDDSIEDPDAEVDNDSFENQWNLQKRNHQMTFLNRDSLDEQQIIQRTIEQYSNAGRSPKKTKNIIEGPTTFSSPLKGPPLPTQFNITTQQNQQDVILKQLQDIQAQNQKFLQQLMEKQQSQPSQLNKENLKILDNSPSSNFLDPYSKDMQIKVNFIGVSGSMRKRREQQGCVSESNSDSDEEFKQGISPSNVNNAHRPSTQVKSKKESKKDSKVIGFGHDNWNLVLHMMFGVSKSVRNALHAEDFKILPEDFKVKYSYELISQKMEQDQQAMTYQFFDFSPRVFHQLRKNYGISADEYLKSTGPENLIGSMVMGNVTSLKEQISAGKSGSFFYYTPDSKYMLKTISHAEFNRLKEVLSQYYEHMVKYPQTLITRFFGLHKIKYVREQGGVQRIYFIIMANVFNTSLPIQVRYDLKGSKFGRRTRRHADDKVDPQIALKDLDFEQDKTQIHLDPLSKQALLKQIKIDVNLFQLLEINDYSLLLGIHELPNGAAQGNQMLTKHDQKSKFSYNDKVTQVLDKEYGQALILDSDRFDQCFFESIDGGMLSEDRKKIYFIGIIDTLTYFGPKKQFEYYSKRIIQGNTISCIPPRSYGDRFYSFMENIIE